MDEQQLINMQDIRQMRLMQELGIDNPQYGAPQLERPEEKFLEQLNPDLLCKIFENMLRGKYWDSEQEKFVEMEGSRKVNEEGIAEIMKMIRSKVNTSTIYGNLGKELVEDMTVDTGQRLSLLLSLNYRKYDMQLMDINTITNDACDLVNIALSRGIDAITLRLLRTMIQSKELTTNQAEQKKKGIDIMGLLRGRK